MSPYHFSERQRGHYALRELCQALQLAQGAYYVRNLPADYGGTQSISRQGNCYDNARANSGQSRLKMKLPNGDSFASLAEARLGIAHYLACHNAERRHSGPDYQSPNYINAPFQPAS